MRVAASCSGCLTILAFLLGRRTIFFRLIINTIYTTKHFENVSQMKFPSTKYHDKKPLAENPEKMRNTHTHFLIKETILVRTLFVNVR